MAVFRAVENRRTVVRAANTGISCFIGPAGDIYEIVEVEGEDGVVRRRNVAGTAVGEVKICDDVTLYMRFRDWFAWTCMVVSLGVLGWCVARRRIR
jgi:apolipoprotein N-acyltransferase